MRGRERSDFLKEKLKRVRKALQQLKKDKKIKGFRRSGSFGFARRMEVDFYVVYLDGQKHIGRPLWIARSGEENKSNKTIWVSPFESEKSLRTKILEAVERL